MHTNTRSAPAAASSRLAQARRDGAALEREVERRRGPAEAADLGDPGALARGQPERAAHEADTDDGDGADGGVVHGVR